ncbi:Aste57867_1774 [Aphanomyces stellatus]|uniref:Aste57867_1774 protein n=1 Tax=Aphanomyces stellatus TaxID=120398 RepID=A0A485K635_9STRA|nr:hypothetical protein As57867_001772 [Aphanomyces stellatus]VFT78983.1 Aste57867_1774 [Aphanomyces stellatus]
MDPDFVTQSSIPLCIAAAQGHVLTFEFLAKVNSNAMFGDAGCLAAWAGHAPLLEITAKLHARTRIHLTTFGCAGCGGHVAAFEWLWQHQTHAENAFRRAALQDGLTEAIREEHTPLGRWIASSTPPEMRGTLFEAFMREEGESSNCILDYFRPIDDPDDIELVFTTLGGVDKSLRKSQLLFDIMDKAPGIDPATVRRGERHCLLVACNCSLVLMVRWLLSNET